MRTEEKLYTVYRLKNVITGKNYIGCTSQKPKERWCREYTGKMKEAINAFPLDLCWKKHIEFQTPNKEQALELESELMKWYDSIENGYNTSSYGSSHYKKYGEKNSMFGKHHSEASKRKMSEASIKNPSKLKKAVLQYSMNGELIAEYSSTRDAERQTGCHHQHICYCCRGKYKYSGGYIWKYKED